MKKTSIRFRLMVMVIILATLPVILSTIVATGNIRESSTRESINANKARIGWGASYLEELIAQMDRMFYSLQINEELGDSIKGLDDPDVFARYNSQNYVADTLSTAYYANSRKIDELIYYSHDNKKTFSVSYKVIGDIKMVDGLKDYWERLEVTETNVYFEPFGESIYAVHSLNRFQDKKMYGGLAVKIRSEVWDEIINILEPVEAEHVFVLNDQRKLIAGSTQLTAIEGLTEIIEPDMAYYEVQLIESKDYFFFAQTVDDGKLLLIKAVPVTQIRAGEFSTIRAAIMITLLFVAAAIFASVIFSIRISRPIVELAKTMRLADLEGLEVSGNQSIDEIALLENGYNKMVSRLKDLIQEEYQHEIELKNAQLLALQAQINPHFLNNSLNLIGGMALDKDAPEIYEVARSISDLLRYSVTDSKELVNLHEELTHVGNYLKIQQRRYEGRCNIIYDIDDDVRDVLVPKFILQPIIENAFEYGLQPKPGDWRLAIKVFQTANRVGLVVIDNGVGMERNKLAQLRGMLANDDAYIGSSKTSNRDNEGKRGTGIGMKNVVQRLKLRFNRKSGIRVFSRENRGTMVLLTIVNDERGNLDV